MARSKAFLETRQPVSFAYGPHAKEGLDFFRAEDAKGVMIFFHGGFWRSCSKEDHDWVARDFVRHGISVAILDYPLCPQSRFADINASVIGALPFLFARVLDSREKARVMVAGHSAGGYLAGLYQITDWTKHGLERRPFGAMYAISGIFDLRPLTRTLMNEWLGLSAADAAALSVDDKTAIVGAASVLAVGERESAEFHRQSDDLAKHWPAVTDVLELEGRAHFDALDDFALEGGALFRRALSYFSGV